MKNCLFFTITLCFFFLNQALAKPKFDKIINSKEDALLPPPSNDDPCNATPLNVGTTCSFVNGTNASATASTGVPAPVALPSFFHLSADLESKLACSLKHPLSPLQLLV